MILITTDTELRTYVPNALATVAGEMSLFDKIRADLELSEQWLTIHFVEASLIEKIVSEEWRVAELVGDPQVRKYFESVKPLVEEAQGEKLS